MSILFSAFEKACNLLWGTGIGRIPGVLAAYYFLSQHLWLDKGVIEIEGSKMYMNTDELPERYGKAFRAYAIFHSWEKSTTEIFKNVIKPGDVVLDLGANMGYFTLLAARLVGREGRVYAFEPAPLNYSLLTKNIELNGYDNVVPLQKAVSNVPGVVRLFLSDEDIGNNTIYSYGNEREVVEVEGVTLDEFFADKEHSINVIKMDVEGAEVAAISGMERIIKENKDLKIFSEFYPSLIRAMGYSPEDFLDKLINNYHFSVIPLDLPRGKKELRPINTIDELMSLLKNRSVVNLFLNRE